MMQWQNCIALETEQAYNNNVRITGNICDYFNSFPIIKPNSFPAFFYLEQGAYPYWKACSKDSVLKQWETAVQGFENKIKELKNGY